MGAIVSALAFPVPDKEWSADLLLERKSQLVKLVTKSGLSIPAISIKGSSTARYTVIYSHGNAEDVGLSLNYLDRFASLCDCNIFAYEYPGYSVSDGEPSEQNCYEAIYAAYDHVTTTMNIPTNKIVLFGRSLGSGPTVDMASLPNATTIAGVILQSPLESGIRAVLGQCTSYGLYPIDIFRNYSKVHLITCPVFIMHGTADRVVPCDNGRNLYSTLQQRECHIDYPPQWVLNKGHNNMPERECLYECRKFLQFLQQQSK